jgi:hypothetical protein
MPNQAPWNYILVFSDDVGTRDQVKRFIDSRTEIITWYFCMSNAIFIRSRQTAGQLTTMFREFTGDSGRFIILDCATDRNGWLPKEAWAFMKGEYPSQE